MACYSAPAGLDFTRGDSAWRQGLHAERAEIKIRTAFGKTVNTALMRFAEFGGFRLQHGIYILCLARRRAFLRQLVLRHGVMGKNFTLEYPNLNTANSVCCVSSRNSIINISFERVEPDPTFANPFGTADLRAIETSADHDLAAGDVHAHGRGHRPLDRTTIGDTALKLVGDVLRDQRRVDLWTLDLTDVHEAVYADGLPVLRKEFIFDSYQIHESRAYGADAILLIVSMLSKQQISDFMDIAASLSLQCLVEVHDDEELDIAVDCGAEIIGVNNRNLRTFETSLETTELLAPRIPAGKIVVSESGISNKMDIERVRIAGAHAVLVGESLVRSHDPSHALRLLM